MRAAKGKTVWIIALLAILVAGAAALPFLVPLDRFIPEIEAIAKARTGMPVKIHELRLFLMPTPHVTASGIEIGSKEVQIGDVSIYPEIGSLFSETRVIRLVEVHGLALHDTLFAKLKLPKDMGGPKAVEVRRVLVHDLRPTLKGSAVGVWNADVTLGGAIGVERAEIESADGKLVASLLPRDKHWDLSIAGKDWKPPLGPPILFTTLTAHGRLTEKTLDVPALKATLYGGTLTAALKAEFPQRWSLSGNYAGENIDVGALGRVFDPKQALGGRLKTNGTLAASAAKPEALANALGVNGAFVVTDGVLHGFDLAGAAAKMLKGGTKGGETRFDKFTGDYQLAGGNVKLRNLVVESGALAAKGNVDITGPQQQLGGTVDVALKASKGLVGVPVALSGTVKDPTITPTKGTAIGAAVGTVLLPGVGTAIGSRVGRFFEKKTEK